MSVVIRTAEPADVPAMHRIRLDVRENRLSDPSRVTEESYRPYIEARCAWVAETSSGIAGFAILDARDGSVWALFVDPDAEGAGIGRALHLRLLECAASVGLARLSLTTAPGTRAEQFYAKAGWESVGPTPEGEVCFERTTSRVG